MIWIHYIFSEFHYKSLFFLRKVIYFLIDRAIRRPTSINILRRYING